MDEFDLEVTLLGEGSPPGNASQDTADTAERDAHRFATSLASTSLAAMSVSGTHRRRCERMRVLRAGAVTVAIVSVFTAILLVPAGTRSAVFQLLGGPTATPTPTLLPEGDLFLWEHTVPWGTLLIDGRQGPDIRGPSAEYNQQGDIQAAGFHLARGKHTLDYRAALFPTLHCTISVPRAGADTCPLDIQNTFPFLVKNPGIRVLDLQATVDRLSSEQARALATVTQDALDTAAEATGPGAIARGDHIRAADGQATLVTDTPLTIQARFTLSDSVTLDRSVEVVHCALLCSSTDLFAQSQPDAWMVYAPVKLSWRYVGGDGRVILDNGPAVADELRGSVVVVVAARWEQNQWQVQLTPAGPRLHDPVLCAVGRHALDVLRISPLETTVDLQIQWPYEATTPGLGCLLAGSKKVDVAGNLGGAVALVLYRCGVLLAVNAEAQRIFPHLPHASVHEQALAWAVAPPGVTIGP